MVTDLKPFKLSQDMMLGYAPIDDEHLHLVGLINELAELPDGDNDGEIVRKFEAMVRVFELHCQSETRILRELGFPEADAQGQHHDNLIEQLNDIGSALKNGNGAEGNKGLFLETLWVFIEEAIKEDLRAKSFLIEQGIAP